CRRARRRLARCTNAPSLPPANWPSSFPSTATLARSAADRKRIDMAFTTIPGVTTRTISNSPQPRTAVRQRRGQAVEQADAIEQGAEWPEVVLQFVRAVGLETDVDPVRDERLTDRPDKAARVDGVMHDVEGRDDVVLRRQARG